MLYSRGWCAVHQRRFATTAAVVLNLPPHCLLPLIGRCVLLSAVCCRTAQPEPVCCCTAAAILFRVGTGVPGSYSIINSKNDCSIAFSHGHIVGELARIGNNKFWHDHAIKIQERQDEQKNDRMEVSTHRLFCTVLVHTVFNIQGTADTSYIHCWSV